MFISNKRTRITVPRAIASIVLLSLVLGTYGIMTLRSTTQSYEGLISDELAMGNSIDEVNIHILQARRAEKDFMLRGLGDFGKRDVVGNEIGNISEHLLYIEATTELVEIKNEIKLFENDKSIYLTKFNDMSSNLIARGGGIFGSDNGLVGAFRYNVHAIENTLVLLYADGSINNTEFFQLNSLMLNARRTEKDYLLRYEAEDVSSMIASIPIFRGEFMTVLNNTSTNASMISYYTDHWDAYIEKFNDLVSIDSTIASETNEFRDATHRMETRLAYIRDEIKIEVAGSIDEINIMIQRENIMMICIQIILILISSAIGVYLVRKIIGPLKLLSDEFEILKNGNLQSNLEFATVPTLEIQSLGDGYAEMKTQLRHLITDVSDLSGIISDASENLTASAEEVNSSAQEVSATSQAMSDAATSQTELISDVNFNINELKKLMDEIIAKIHSNTQEVSQIATQTNILALNAGIEASRAGDYGRGFAVVAENVRKLSDQSKMASERIQTVASEIQTTMQDSFTKIVSSMINVVSVSEETAASAEEVAAAAQEMTATMEEVTSNALQLSTRAKDSKRVVERFTL